MILVRIYLPTFYVMGLVLHEYNFLDTVLISVDMTSAQHKEILERFTEGTHKILVATNVLEEGLDVAECNLVIRLNYVPSDTGHVQVKGESSGVRGYLIIRNKLKRVYHFLHRSY